MQRDFEFEPFRKLILFYKGRIIDRTEFIKRWGEEQKRQGIR